MKKIGLAVLVTVFISSIGLSIVSGSNSTPDPDKWITEKIDGWNDNESAITGRVKEKCEMVANKIKQEISNPNVFLFIRTRGSATNTGPIGENDKLGFFRDNNVRGFFKGKFPNADISGYSIGIEPDERIVELQYQIIPIISPPEVPPAVVTPPVVAKETSILDNWMFWLILLVIILIAIWLIRRRPVAKVSDQELIKPKNIDELINVIKNKDSADKKISCPGCLKEILGKNMKRHLFERCPDLKNEVKKQLSEELDKQRPKLEKGESHEKTI